MPQQDTIRGQKENLQNLIREHNRRLQILRQQEAQQGLSVDPKIITEIEDIEEKIRELEAELDRLSESPKSLKILVVDDEEAQAEILYTSMEISGFTVDKETDPRKVWHRVQQKKYDIIFLDLIMPRYEYNGIETLVDIKTFSPGSRVIAITGYARGDQIAEVMHLGASAFIARTPDTPVQKYLDKMSEVMSQSSIFREDELRERLIRRLWNRVQSGKSEFFRSSLEGLIKLALESVTGFVSPCTSIGDGEEIHIEFENQRDDAFWRDLGGLIHIECRNWSGEVVGLEEYRHFQSKLTFARLGFFISYTSFTDELRNSLSTTGPQNPLIVLIDRNDLEKLINIKPEKREELLRNHVRNAMRGYHH